MSGVQGHEFKPRQPDGATHLVKWQIHLSEYSRFMIVSHLTIFWRFSTHHRSAAPRRTSPVS